MVRSFTDRFVLALEEAGHSTMISKFPSSRPWLRLLVFVPVVALVAFLTLIAITIAIVVVPALSRAFERFGERIEDTPVRLVEEAVHGLIFAGSVGALAVSILATAALIWRQPLKAFLWPERKVDLRLFGVGFLAMLLAATVWMAVDMASGGVWRPPVFDTYYIERTRIIYVAVMAVALLVGAAAEEVICRGVLLRMTGVVTRQALVLCLINGILFSAIHLDPDPSAFVARTLSGMAWTWATLRLGGLEFAIGGHFANNLFLTLAASPLSDGWQVRKTDWFSLIPETLVTVFVVIVVEWLVRRRLAPASSSTAEASA